MQAGRPANRVCQTGGWVGRQADQQTGCQTDGLACRHVDQQKGCVRPAVVQAGRETSKQEIRKGGLACRQADQQTGARPVNMYKNGGSRQRSMQHAGSEKVSIRDNLFVL
jgi:hypothetical protein